MVEQQEKPKPNWIANAKARHLDSALLLLLDVLEPFGPLASQFLLVVQPMAGAFGARHVIGDIADALDDPQEIQALRAYLQDE